MNADLTAREMLSLAGREALERKIGDMTVLDLRGLCSYTDFLLVVTAMSSRQVHAVAEHIRRRASKQGLKPLAMEGERGGRWTILDYGPLIIHVFLDEVRDYYDLEGLWSDAPAYTWGEADDEPDIPEQPTAQAAEQA